MASSKIRRALGAVKDQTSIGLAKVGSSNSLSDLEVAIVKATKHEEYPAEERHIREILSLTSYSRTYISACVNTLARRLNKTKNWTVALKTLMLVQRLLAEGDPAYEQEIFFATRRGTRLLNMSDFRDGSKSNSWDYSAFVRTYALYLDERLEFRMQGRRGKRSAFGIDEEEDDTGLAICVRSTPVRDLRNEHIFSRIQHLQQLLERFLACRPTGGAKHNRVLIVALYPVVKESFQIYYDITEILGILIDRFMELEIPDSVKVYEIFCRVSKQFDELGHFYSWCKNVGIARSSEYPEVEKMTQKKLDIMDEFIRDKSALAQTKRFANFELKNHETEDQTKESETNQEDINAIKALPPPEGFTETAIATEGGHERTEKEVKKEHDNGAKQEADLLNLGEDETLLLSSEEHSNRLALALFDDGALACPGPSPPAWEAFNDDAADWETALVQSASNLSGQKAALGGGFDIMFLNGMYQQGAAGRGFGGGGSASSAAIGSGGMLALPAPPASENGGDPFAASAGIAPPAYVQMSEMEKKEKLLVEEQMMWQQYARDGMKGHLGFAKLHPNSYGSLGGFTRH